jgi:pimeloyl-ACP methyl ester carboxylesterase
MMKHRLVAVLTAGSLLAVTSLLTASVLPQQGGAQTAAAAPLLSAANQQLTADGVTLRYRDAGSGDALVLIHGYIARAHLIGHSMGALIAANVASRYPDRVSSAGLVAGPFYADESTFNREAARWTADLESGKGLTNFMLWLFPAFKPQMAAGFNAQIMKANDLDSLIAVMRSLPKLAIAGLPKNGAKVLLVAGTGDPLFPLSPAFAKQSPGARVVEIAGADHANVITNAQAVSAIREQLQR